MNCMRALLFRIMVMTAVTAGCAGLAFAGGPMKICSGWSDNADETAAVTRALSMMKREFGKDTPKLVTVFVTGKQYNHKKIFASLRRQLKPDVRIWGLNSDLSGIVQPGGIHRGLTVTGFYSPNMTVGVGSAKLDWHDQDGYAETGKRALLAALKNAGKTANDRPSLLLLASLHLVDDAAIYGGMESLVGETPVWGGNAGQDSGTGSLPGDGWCYYNTAADTACVSVAALWLDTKVGMSYGYGYQDKPQYRGVVTKADVKKRLVYEIDHRPAVAVYNEWTGGKLTGIISKGGGAVPLSILGKYELKKSLGKGVADYVLVGVPFIYPDGSMFMSHEAVPEGTALSLVEFANENDVVNKPASIATIARIRADIPKEEIAGALFVYCYAQFYVARSHGYTVDTTFPLLTKSLGGAPYTGFLGGGEIGYRGGGSILMMHSATSIVIFGKY